MQKLYENAIKNFIIRKISSIKVDEKDKEKLVEYIDSILVTVRELPVNEKTTLQLIGFLPMVPNVIYEFKTNTEFSRHEIVVNQLNNSTPNIEDKNMYKNLLDIWSMIVDYDEILKGCFPITSDSALDECERIYILMQIINQLISLSSKIIYTQDYTDNMLLEYKKFFDWFGFNYEFEIQEVLKKLTEVEW